MPLSILIRIILVRTGVVFVIAIIVLSGLFAIDYFLGTNVIAVIWQWVVRLWQLIFKWLQFSGKFLLRLVPGFMKRFMLRKGMSGVWKLLGTGFLAVSFASLGGKRYEKLSSSIVAFKIWLLRMLQLIWNAEIWFFPKWMRAVVFIIALISVIIGFIEVQAWATRRNSPTILGIDPWSLTFGFIASYVLTKLPLIGFDHFVSFIFRPLQKNFQRLVRRSGGVYILLNWALALRPLRRRAELERILYMRRWKVNQNHEVEGLTREPERKQV